MLPKPAWSFVTVPFGAFSASPPRRSLLSRSRPGPSSATSCTGDVAPAAGVTCPIAIVPRMPIVPIGIFTTMSAGLFFATCPVTNRNTPLATDAVTLPEPLAGS